MATAAPALAHVGSGSVAPAATRGQSASSGGVSCSVTSATASGS
jgi:hypothetical protein